MTHHGNIKNVKLTGSFTLYMYGCKVDLQTNVWAMSHMIGFGWNLKFTFSYRSLVWFTCLALIELTLIHNVINGNSEFTVKGRISLSLALSQLAYCQYSRVALTFSVQNLPILPQWYHHCGISLPATVKTPKRKKRPGA